MTTAALPDLLWPEECAALRPPPDLTVAEWADRYRELDPINHAEAGPWDTNRVPYLRGVMEAYRDRTTRKITFMCSTQVGKTEALLNCLLYTIAQDPVPSMLVGPSQLEVEGFAERRLKLSIDYCPPTAARRTARKADDKKHEQAFDGMVLYFAWPSPSRLASRSIGRVFFDEVDKYPLFVGREADPISLAEERLSWFADSKSYRCSTPTTEAGLIWREWKESSQEWFHVPCPFCGHFQPLKFNRDTVRWPDEERDPVRIERYRLASYVCVECETWIPDDDQHKRQMMLSGVWCPEGAEVTPAGKVRGAPAELPEHRGFHVNKLYSPVKSWSHVAAEFLRAKDDTARLLGFTNSALGWPWVEKSSETTTDYVRQLQCAHPRSSAPSSAVVLTAGVDVQKDHLYYAIRAWAPGERSWLVEADVVDRFEQLHQALLRRAFPLVNEHGEVVEELPVRLLLIDSRYRRDEVLDFCEKHPEVARAIQGATHQTMPIKMNRMRPETHGRHGQLWTLDVHYFKDKWSRLVRTARGARGSWQLHKDPTEEYLLQVTSEHKVLERSGRQRATVQEVWQKKPGAGGNHWFDTEVYAIAAADMLGVWRLEADDDERRAESLVAERERVERRPKAKEGGFIRRGGEKRGRGGWIRRGR